MTEKKIIVNCPYCESKAELRDRAGFGNIWICTRFPECDSYVGCHPGTDTALGSLANKELRSARVEAHTAFDLLWRAKIRTEKGLRKTARSEAYTWLAAQLGINASDCHIGMFDVATCKRVVAICQPYRANPIELGKTLSELIRNY